MTLSDQVNRLLGAGLADAAGITAAELTSHAEDLPDEPGAILAVHPSLVSPRRLAALLRHQDKPGFVVEDMTDLEQFVPIDGVSIPDRPLYLVLDLDRGDDLRNRTPNEALPVITERGRTPLTVNEGISWLLQEPHLLAPNYCFMTIGSRRRHGAKADARTPAIWISRGTGRDGALRRNAPKVGWCWAGNRHTWLGIASARRRSPASHDEAELMEVLPPHHPLTRQRDR